MNKYVFTISSLSRIEADANSIKELLPPMQLDSLVSFYILCKNLDEPNGLELGFLPSKPCFQPNGFVFRGTLPEKDILEFVMFLENNYEVIAKFQNLLCISNPDIQQLLLWYTNMEKYKNVAFTTMKSETQSSVISKNAYCFANIPKHKLQKKLRVTVDTMNKDIALSQETKTQILKLVQFLSDLQFIIRHNCQFLEK